MPQTGSRADPFGAFRFRVELDGIATAAFTEVTGLSSSTDVIEYRTGNTRIAAKLPGLNKYANIVLKRGITHHSALLDWFNETRRLGAQSTRKEMSITLIGPGGETIRTWSFTDAYPVKWTGPTLNAASNQIATESLEIAHTGLKAV